MKRVLEEKTLNFSIEVSEEQWKKLSDPELDAICDAFRLAFETFVLREVSEQQMSIERNLISNENLHLKKGDVEVKVSEF